MTTQPPHKRRGTAAAVGTPSPAATRVLRQFRLVFNSVKTHFQQVEKAAGVGGAQIWALSVIRDKPLLGVNDLARAMDIHQTTASNLVKALTASGLVIAQRNGLDKRAVQLKVLPAGRTVLRKAPGPLSGVLPSALERLNPTTLARLEKDLTQLINVLDADERGAGIPLAQM